jgi:CAAX protease family protein
MRALATVHASTPWSPAPVSSAISAARASVAWTTTSLATVGPVLAVVAVARAVVITPLAEELLFRGALYGWLRRWWPAWATIAATAVAFAGIHGFLVVMPYVLVFGIVTGWLRERTGSVAAGVVTHVLNNAILVTMTFVLTG